jgi:hypothetical protein
MNMRKFAVLGGLAAGAALVFAPLASADDLSSVLSGEESVLNGQFDLDALLAGDSSDVTAPTAADPFATITPADIATVQGNGVTATPFDYEVYGVSPITAGLASDPGSYNVLNGAEAKFDDAYNVLYSALLNNGALDTNAADYIGNLPTGFASDTPAQAFEYFYNFGIGDLSGFFDTNLTSLDLTASEATDLFSLLGSL